MRKVNPFVVLVVVLVVISIITSTDLLPSWAVVLLPLGAGIVWIGWLVMMVFFHQDKIIIKITRRQPRRFQLTAEQASTGAKAWARKLCPSIPDDYFGEGTPRWAIRQWAEPERAKASPEQVEAFRKALLLHLVDGLDKHCIGCDYGPDEVLSHALRSAGIFGISPLPEKSCMTFNDGGVQASWEYQQPSEELLPKKEVISLS